MPDVIITCEQCATQFQLDDSRVPEAGVRVRCSRCKHSFFVKPESPSGHSVEKVVEQALEADGSTQELGPPSRGSLGSPSPLDDALDESDWEFNDGAGTGKGSDPGLSAARDVVDDLLGPTPAKPRPPAPAPEPPTPQPLDVAPAPSAPEPAAEKENEQLGSPENWDFLADEESSPAPRAVALGRIRLLAEPSERPPIDVEVEPSPAVVWLGRVWQAAGWGAVIVLGMLGLERSLVPAAPQPLVPAVQTIAGLEAAEVEGHWLENAEAGPVFVVSGQLRNLEPRVIVPGARFAVRLLDARGGVVAEEAAALGPALPERRLREESPRELRALQAEASLAQARSPMGPGSVRPFHAVLDEIPAAATRFDLGALPVEEPPPAPEAAPEPAPGSPVAAAVEPEGP